MDGETLAVVDRRAYAMLAAVLREGVVRHDLPLPAGRVRALSDDERGRLLAQLPGLVPTRACPCGDAVCLTYAFGAGAVERVIEFAAPDVSVLELGVGGRILRFECVVDSRLLT